MEDASRGTQNVNVRASQKGAELTFTSFGVQIGMDLAKLALFDVVRFSSSFGLSISLVDRLPLIVHRSFTAMVCFSRPFPFSHKRADP